LGESRLTHLHKESIGIPKIFGRNGAQMEANGGFLGASRSQQKSDMDRARKGILNLLNGYFILGNSTGKQGIYPPVIKRGNQNRTKWRF